jgi:hypothetical protein
MNTKFLGNCVFSIFASLTLLFSTVPGLAQSTAQNPGSPAVATISAATTPSTSSQFGLKITACRYTFDWDTYIADQKAGRANSNPYIDQGCVSGSSSDFKTGAKYSALEIGQPATKTAYGNDPIVGIFTNGTYKAQSLDTYKTDGTALKTEAISERNVVTSLNTVFTESQLNSIYSTGGAKTAMPRIFSTGPDEYRTLADGKKSYRGGRCKVENGKISVRTKRAGQDFNPSLYGVDPSKPLESCAREVDGKRLATVEDQNLKAYQFVYEFKFPTAAQCQDFFQVDATTCLTFFRNRYGRDLAGNSANVTRTLSVYTYFGSFDDLYSQWVGWVNPDIDGPRKTSDDGFVRAYDGYSVYGL